MKTEESKFLFDLKQYEQVTLLYEKEGTVDAFLSIYYNKAE